MTEQEVNNLIDSKIGKVKMSQLPEATKTEGLYSIGYTGNQSVKYKANLLQGDPLTIRKTYQTEAEALADKNPIDPTTSLPLTVGQFVSIVDDGEKNGIYRIASISGDGTMSLELQGKLGDLSDYATQSDLVQLAVETDNKLNGGINNHEARMVSGSEVAKRTLLKSVFLNETRNTVNLFDKTAIIRYKRLNLIAPHGIEDRNYAGGEIFSISDYIFVKAGQQYSISGWFSSSASKRIPLFSGINDTVPVESFTGVDQFTPAADSYVVVDVTNTTVDFIETLQIQEGEATPYEPYSDEVVEKIKSDYLEVAGNVEEKNENAVSGGEVYDKTLTKAKYLDILMGKNRYDKNANENGFIEYDGTLVFSVTQYTTGFIPVRAGQAYTISGGYNSASAKRVLVFSTENDLDVVEYIQGEDVFTPSQDGYIKTNAITNTADVSETLQIEEGTEATSYEPYIGILGEKIREKYIYTDGIVEPLNDKPVAGGEVYDKTLTKAKYLEEKRVSRNIFDKSAVFQQRALNLNGGIFTPSNENLALSDWMFLEGGKSYFVSGWFSNSDENFYSLFRNYGDTTTDLTDVKLVSETGLITPEQDCWLVVSVSRQPAAGVQDVRDTLQVEEGDSATAYEPYSDEIREFIKEEYIPDRKAAGNDVGTYFNLFNEENISFGKLELNGDFTPNENGDMTIEFLELPKVSYLYVSGLGSGAYERVYKIYDENRQLISWWAYDRFVGSNYRITLQAAAKYISIYFKNENEDIDLSKVVFSPYKESILNDSGVIDIREKVEHKKTETFLDSDNVENVDTNVNFTINSTSELKNALIPIFIHKGSRPSGASILERHIYVGDDIQNDFSDIGILSNGKHLRIEVNAGNYSLIPQNSLKLRMFQDADGYLLGSNFYEGIFRSDDDGRTWTLLKADGAKIIFMAANGDIFYQVAQTLRRATKASNYVDENICYTSPYSSLILGFNNIAQNTNGDIYFGTYQADFHVRVYKSTDGGANFTEVFANDYKQHVHKIWCHNGVVFLNIDGATVSNPNDEIPENKSMACYKSEDDGATWEMVKYNWSTDYGINQYANGYYYGSAEANIKYSPSLYRSKDLVNWETIFNLPFNSQSMRSFDGTLVLNSVAYWSFNRAKTWLSYNGVDFLPIFDTKNLDSLNMDAALRMGTQESPDKYFTDSDGEKWMPLCSGSNHLDHYKLKLGGDNYQALVYMQCDLTPGDNTFTIINTQKNHYGLVAHKDDSYMYSVEFGESSLTTSNQVRRVYPENTAISNGRFDGFHYPFKEKDEVSVCLGETIHIPAKLEGVKAMRFGYKSYKWNGSEEVLILSIGGNSVKRRGSSIVLSIGGAEYELSNALRVYYDTTCLDVLITLDGVKARVYLNGFEASQVDCAEQSLLGDGINIQEHGGRDFVSNIYLYDYVVDSDKAKEIFEGFNIV